MEFVETISYLALTYIVFALALNIAVGYAGMLSVGHSAFSACGAYTSSLLALRICQQVGFVGIQPLPYYAISVVAAVFLSMIVGGFIGLLTWRLKGDFFVFATLAFEEIARAVLSGSTWSGGNLGIHAIPRFAWGRDPLSRAATLIPALLAAGSAFWLSGKIERSGFGHMLQTLGTDESMTITLGESPLWLRTRALMISSGMFALGGALIAPYYGYIDPSFFGLQESILVLSMVLLGGVGSRVGATLGAMLLVGIPVLLPRLHAPVPWRAELEQIVYGLILILTMRLCPFGIFGRRVLR